MEIIGCVLAVFIIAFLLGMNFAYNIIAYRIKNCGYTLRDVYKYVTEKQGS